MSELDGIKWPVGMYAPGNYTGKCGSCGAQFAGDKRARQCLPCAVNGLQAAMRREREISSLLRGELVGAFTTMQAERGGTYEASRAKAEARVIAMLDAFEEARALSQ